MSTDTQWGSLIRRGYQVVYAVEIEGIPTAFGAREMWTTAGLVATHPTRAMSYGLALREGAHISVEADRQSGAAAGRALDITIGRQQLADEGLGAALFARPTMRANLTVEVSDTTTATFVVDSTSGWPSSGGLYVGREYCTYSGKTATSFTGITRGVAGLAHYHTANAFGAYRQATDKPVYWRGRLVTLWAHLVSPEGRYLGDSWCTLGSYCRQEWRGFVRDTPRPAQDGITIACLPLVRMASQEIGAEAQGRVLNGWIVAEASDTITIYDDDATVIAEVPTAPLAGDDGIIPITQWAAVVANHLTGLGVPTSAHTDAARIVLRINVPSVSVSTNAWFLRPLVQGTLSGNFVLNLIWAGDAIVNGWLVVKLDAAEDSADVLVGESGMLAIDIDGHTEVVIYDGVRRVTDSPITAFRIVRRAVFGTSSFEQNLERTTYYNPWTTDASVRVISGYSGSWSQCLRALLTSSGMTGARGPYDLLAYGFGLGLPDDWIAETTEGFDAITNGPPIDAVTTQQTTIEDLLCGWLALTRKALVQRRQTDGSIRLEVISTDVTDNAGAETLDASDVTLDGHDTPEVIEAPNHIHITASDALTERPLFIVRDAARAQNEGVRSIKIKAPGIQAADADRLGGEMIILGDGQAAVRLKVAPWLDIQPGDQRRVTTAHPAIWDWSAGSFAPAEAMGVVLTWERDITTYEQWITLLLAGQAQERLLLCPTAIVVGSASATVYTVDDSTGFVAGHEVRFYEVTNEDADSAVVTITDVTGNVITVDGDPGVTGTEIEITYADYGDAVTLQRRYMYVRSDREWR